MTRPDPHAPLFRTRPPSRGYGWSANGVAGWLFTAGFMGAFGLTFGLAMSLAVDGHPLWPVAALAAVLLLGSFLFVAWREAARP